MAEAIRQQLLNLLPLVVDGEAQGVPWSTKQLEKVTGFPWQLVSSTIGNLQRTGAVVNVGGNRKTGYLWAKKVMRIEDGRGRHGNHAGGRPRQIPQRLRQAARGPSLTSTRGELRRRNNTNNA